MKTIKNMALVVLAFTVGILIHTNSTKQDIIDTQDIIIEIKENKIKELNQDIEWLEFDLEDSDNWSQYWWEMYKFGEATAPIGFNETMEILELEGI